MAAAPVAPEQLEIRAWREEDAHALGAAITASLEHLRPWMPWIAEEPLTDAERRARIWVWGQARAAGGDETLGVFLDGEVVGGCGMHHRIAPGGVEIGYWVHVDHVRRGIATGLSERLVAEAFARPSTTHVEIHHDVANEASGAVPRRLGFRVVGEEERAPTAPGETGRERRWRLDRPEPAAG